MDGINDLEYKELRLDLVDLTEGVVTVLLVRITQIQILGYGNRAR